MKDKFRYERPTDKMSVAFCTLVRYMHFDYSIYISYCDENGVVHKMSLSEFSLERIYNIASEMDHLLFSMVFQIDVKPGKRGRILRSTLKHLIKEAEDILSKDGIQITTLTN